MVYSRATVHSWIRRHITNRVTQELLGGGGGEDCVLMKAAAVTSSFPIRSRGTWPLIPQYWARLLIVWTWRECVWENATLIYKLFHSPSYNGPAKRRFRGVEGRERVWPSQTDGGSGGGVWVCVCVYAQNCWIRGKSSQRAWPLSTSCTLADLAQKCVPS